MLARHWHELRGFGIVYCRVRDSMYIINCGTILSHNLYVVYMLLCSSLSCNLILWATLRPSWDPPSVE